MSTHKMFGRFIAGSLREVTRGGLLYWGWVFALLVMIAFGFWSYLAQLDEGLVTTSMRDQVSWAFYIGNFTFLVGVAAAAVLLDHPGLRLSTGSPIKRDRDLR